MLALRSTRRRSMLTRLAVRTLARSFASPAVSEPPQGEVREWIVIAPDQQKAVSRRMECRSRHLQAILPEVNTGWLVFGGPWFTESAQHGGELQMAGSVVVVMARSKEEIVARLKADPYTSENVWDWEKLRIYPFASTVREALRSEKWSVSASYHYCRALRQGPHRKG